VEQPVTATPVRSWHLALLPAVLAANYLFTTGRHEGAHGLVVLAFGGEIAAFHLWPPRGGTFSWITFRLPLDAPALATPLQAAAPSVLALTFLGAALWAVCRRLPPGLLRANVVITGVLFPCAELATTAVGYWYGGNDLYYVLGAPTTVLRWSVAGLGLALAGASLWLALRRILSDGRGRTDGWTTSRPPWAP
jgi:hypothetical protein